MSGNRTKREGRTLRGMTQGAGFRMRASMRGAARAIGSVLLALALVFGFVPCLSPATVSVAFAAEDEDGQAAADQAAAAEVDAIIASLPSAGSITVGDRAAVDAAKEAYDRLTASQKSLVLYKADLDAAIGAVEAAEEAQARAEEEERKRQEEEAERQRQEEEERQRQEAEQQQGEQSGSSASPDAPAAPETMYVKTLLLKWDKPDDAGMTHFVGDNSMVEKAYRQLSITEYGETVQLNGWYLSTDDTGVAYQTADASTTIGSFNLNWSSSDTSVATVSPSGLVTPHGKNGTAVITATVADANVYQGAAPAATVSIAFDGQEGKYVERVEILDEAGNSIGEAWGSTTVYDKQNAFHQLQARVTWRNAVDGSEVVEVTGSGETYDAKNVGTTISWNVSASAAFTINADTGRLRTSQYSGNAYVTCSVVGGKGGTVVEDTANVQLDTGVYEYNPSESLTLKVVWEERPDEVVKEATYSFDELKGMLASRHVNATVVNGSRYGVISADGFLFKDVVGLVSVDDADVLQYRFGTADGYDNPLSYSYLFESGNRYYFPNYDIGSTAEGEIVPPVLAYASTFEWNRSEANPTAELDEGSRFRLVFGCLASGDANTSFQIYYIREITIVLVGAPSAGENDGLGPDKKPTSPSEGVNDGTGGGDNGGGADGTGGSGHGKTGAGNGTNGTGGGNADGNLDGTNGDGRDQAGAEQSTGQGQNTSGGQSDDEGQPEEALAGLDAGAAKRWRVYQMMNKNNSDVPDWDDENPISPFAAPIALGTFAVGAGATGIGFRRRLR